MRFSDGKKSSDFLPYLPTADNLGGALSVLLGHLHEFGIVQEFGLVWTGPGSVRRSQGRVSRQDDVSFLAKVQQLLLVEVRMALHLINHGFDLAGNER